MPSRKPKPEPTEEEIQAAIEEWRQWNIKFVGGEIGW